jgi:hypothetical protein
VLQVFHLHVVKVDLNVAYVSNDFSSVYRCFVSFFETYVAFVLAVAYVCYMFHLDVAKIDLVLHML